MLGCFISWPLSLINFPPRQNLQLVFSHQTPNESQAFKEKLSLTTSPIKRIYYNKTTLFLNRYFANLVNLLDPNNYFFNSHPRGDVSYFVYRQKFPYLYIFPFILGLFTYIDSKKNKLLFSSVIYLILLSFFENTDLLDFGLFFIINYFIYLGLKRLLKLF